MAETYRTLKGPSEAQYRVLGSRHMGYAYPVFSEEEIKQKIDALWKDHHNATHICYAWRLGYEKKLFRVNDDGEPSGTAGKPIFGQIQSADLTNVLIAVVRYYGGTKLGTGGLIDAYKTTSRLCIETGGVVEYPVRDHYHISFNYDQMPTVMKIIKEISADKLSSHFEDSCELEVIVEMRHSVKLIEVLEALEGVKVELKGRR